jgi:hypothetical protein
MDKIDTIDFMSWSAMLYGLLDFSAGQLLACQAAWLAVAFVGRKFVDRWIERKLA